MKDIYFSYYKPKLWQVIHAYNTQLVDASEALKWYAGTRIPFIRYRTKFKTGVLENLSSDPKTLLQGYVSTYLFREFQFNKNNKGYLSHGCKRLCEKDIDVSMYKEYKKGIEKGYSIYIKYFQNLLDFAAQHKIHVIIYEFPWPSPAKSDFFNDILNYYQNVLKEAAGNNPYVHFVTHDHFWDPSLFMDPLHLNQFGAEKLSQKLLDWIEPFITESDPQNKHTSSTNI